MAAIFSRRPTKHSFFGRGLCTFSGLNGHRILFTTLALLRNLSCFILPCMVAFVLLLQRGIDLSKPKVPLLCQKEGKSDDLNVLKFRSELLWLESSPLSSKNSSLRILQIISLLLTKLSFLICAPFILIICLYLLLGNEGIKIVHKIIVMKSHTYLYFSILYLINRN